MKYTVKELAALLKKRELSVTELTRDALAKAANDNLGAFISVTEEHALKSAQTADSMLINDDTSPLCGIPYAVKDNIVTKGIRTTAASKILSDFVPAYSASAVERADSCGGVMIGKTNLDEFAMGSTGENSAFGYVKNPADETRAAGGSSSGSAAAVAGGIVPWALGSDTGGSARLPAAWCGAVAMKPTYGLIPRYGLIAFASSLDTICPITKTVYDNAVVLKHLAGHDRRDMTSVDLSSDVLSDIEKGVSGLKIGLAECSGCTDYVKNCVLRAARILESLGASVEPVSIPSPERCEETYLVIASAEASSNLARYDGIRYASAVKDSSAAGIMSGTRSAGFGDEVKKRILTGTYALTKRYGGGYYPKVKAVRAEIIEEYNRIFEQYDIVIMPTATDTAPLLGNIGGIDAYSSDIYTTAANLTGCPAVTVPQKAGGLPCGATLMGPRFSEHILYRAAYALEVSDD